MKQVIVLRKDLNMRKGKMVAQGAHASMAAIINYAYEHQVKHNDGTVENILAISLEDADVRDWLLGSFKKVCVGCQSEAELLDLNRKVQLTKLPHALIRDSGRTEFHGVLTYTALAVGPGDDDEIDKITGHLTLL